MASNAWKKKEGRDTNKRTNDAPSVGVTRTTCVIPYGFYKFVLCNVEIILHPTIRALWYDLWIFLYVDTSTILYEHFQ